MTPAPQPLAPSRGLAIRPCRCYDAGVGKRGRSAVGDVASIGKNAFRRIPPASQNLREAQYESCRVIS